MDMPLPEAESTYRIKFIPLPLVQRFWPFAEPYVKRALDHSANEFSAANILQSCFDDEMQLWLVSKGTRIVGAVTTKLIQYPEVKHCCIVTLAGSNFGEWVGMAEAAVAEWAKQIEGCSVMSAYVRKGFVPKLQALGFNLKYSVVVKEL